MIGKFRDQHDEMRRLMVDIAQLVESDDADLSTLTRMRRDFARIFHAHSAAERAYICDQCDSATFAHYEARARCFVSDYSAHVTKWTPPAIVADQQQYFAATRTLQQRYFDQMDWEEQALFANIAHSAAA